MQFRVEQEERSPNEKLHEVFVRQSCIKDMYHIIVAAFISYAIKKAIELSVTSKPLVTTNRNSCCSNVLVLSFRVKKNWSENENRGTSRFNTGARTGQFHSQDDCDDCNTDQRESKTEPQPELKVSLLLAIQECWCSNHQTFIWGLERWEIRGSFRQPSSNAVYMLDAILL